MQKHDHEGLDLVLYSMALDLYPSPYYLKGPSPTIRLGYGGGACVRAEGGAEVYGS